MMPARVSNDVHVRMRVYVRVPELFLGKLYVLVLEFAVSELWNAPVRQYSHVCYADLQVLQVITRRSHCVGDGFGRQGKNNGKCSQSCYANTARAPPRMLHSHCLLPN